MITDKEKKEIDKKYLPNGFFWYNIKNEHSEIVLKTFEGSKDKYIELIKKHFSHNATSFISSLRKLEKTKFIEQIEAQFTYYTKEKSGNAEKWLPITKDTILNGGLGVYKVYDNVLRAAFIEWYEFKLSELQPSQTKNNTETEEPQQDENVFCKTMPLNIPKEHFKTLTLKNSKNGLPYLTQNQFNDFINKAFLGKVNLPKQKFNQVPKGEKLKIQYLFRQFYENYCFEYFNTGQTQDVFIKLLTENFIGWEFENVKNNFKTKPKKLI